MAVDLCSLAEVRAEVQYRTGYTDKDALITALIPRASQAIIREFQREFAPATSSATRTFPVYPEERDRRGNIRVDLSPYDLRTVATSGMTLNPEDSSPIVLVAETQYKLRSVNPELAVYTTVLISGLVTVSSAHLTAFGYAQLAIAGAWGFATVPDDVKQAAIETVAAWLEQDVPALALETEDGRALPIAPQQTFSIPTSALKKLAKFSRHGQVF